MFAKKARKKLVDALSDGTGRISVAMRCCIVSNFLFICVNFNDRPYVALTAMAHKLPFFPPRFHRKCNSVFRDIVQSLVQPDSYTQSHQRHFGNIFDASFSTSFLTAALFIHFRHDFTARSPVTQISDCT